MKPTSQKRPSIGNAPLGIDFGTTNSAISRYAKTIMRCSPENLNFPLTGNFLYPSIAFLDDNSNCIRTGNAALNKRFTNAERVVSSVKRIISGDERYELNGRTYSNADIVTKIISDFIGEIKLTDHEMQPQVIVVTVPYYFGENENAVIKFAAEKAVLEQFNYSPKMFLLPEPVAASLACMYGFPDNESLINKIIFIYDIGGGTLDLTLVRISKTKDSFAYEILANDGIANFGGDDIDNLLYDYVLSHERIDMSNLNPCDRKRNRARILDECTQVKHNLSSSENTTFMCTNLIGLDVDYIEINLSRDILDTLLCGQRGSTRNMFKELTECVESLYAKAKINRDDVDYILPIGGTSYVPLFRQQMAALHRHAEEIVAIDQNNSCYGVVANGACIYGAMKSDELFHTDYHPFSTQHSIERMKTRISHSLFLKKYNDKLDLLIEANTLAPVQVEKIYFPSKFQNNGELVDLDSVRLFQGQGFSRKKGNDIGGIDFTHHKIYSHGRKLDEIPIHLVFEVTDTLVQVRCTIPKSDKDGKDICFTQTISQ